MLPSPATVRKRIQYGWDKERAKIVPVQTTNLQRQKKHPSLTKQSVYNRIYRGWEETKAMTTPTLGRGGPRYKL